MREIKFRIYDKEKQRMYQDSDEMFWTGSNGHINIVQIYTGYEDSDEWKNYKLMQYTGLKDRSGKGIYEGDIVYCTGGEYCQGYHEHQATCEIKWQGNGFELVDIKNGCGYGWGFADAFETIEVIGNIHDNSELLGV